MQERLGIAELEHRSGRRNGTHLINGWAKYVARSSDLKEKASVPGWFNKNFGPPKTDAACAYCGYCNTGCPYGRKLGTAQTYLPDACREYAHLGQLHYQQGHYEQAHHFSQQALDESGADKQVRATALTTLGHTFNALGQSAEAQQAYQQALSIRQQMNQHHLTAELITALARCALSP